MSEREKEFMERLLATFKIEARDHIKTIASGLLELEKNSGEQTQSRLIETIYRQAHSLKGSARAVDLTSVETICQSLENVFKRFKSRGIPLSPEVFDILQRTLDTVEEIVSGEAGQEPEISAVIRDLERLKDAPPGTVPAGTAKPAGVEPPEPGTRAKITAKPFTRPGFLPPPPGKDGRTIRVDPARLDRLLLQAEEMILVKLAVNRRLAELEEIGPVFGKLKEKWLSTSRILKSLLMSRQCLPEHESGENWQRVKAYLDDCHARLKELQAGMERITRAFQRDRRFFGAAIDTHLGDMRKALMLPFCTLTEMLPRMVRDLSRHKGKEIELVVKGKEIEIDKRILEEMKDPLVHLVRNAVDHGIETPRERAAKNKPARGVIEVIISREENNRVEIVVSDDGTGIDTGKIKAAAVRAGLYTDEKINRLTHGQIRHLIFSSEFTTSPIITELSGRGLGLAIVRENVEKMGGRVTVETHPDQGTTFRILMRMNLGTSRGILVEVARRRFVIPTLNVERAAMIYEKDIKTVENLETVKIGAEVFSYVRLADLLRLPVGDNSPGPNSNGHVKLVVLGVGDRRIAFRVDDIANEGEVLVKDLGRQLPRVRNIAGATLLGSGDVVPILNAADLVTSAIASTKKQKPAPPIKMTREPWTGKKSILVVEDSITSRMLLKNILESAGYEVQVAVDGIEGWAAARRKKFHLALLDVEMPGMDGFELTGKIRADSHLSRMPVVLVTALESREDREKGIDAGADAYIVKSKFDQGNLLDIVKELV